MEALAKELAAGLVRLRKGYVDSAEQLLRLIEPDREYPYEFVLFRLTGFRSPSSEEVMISGKALAHDLRQLMLDVCDSFELSAALYDEPVLDTAQLARRMHVSSKTIQRWRRRGLPTRRLVFADGKRRLGFPESTVRWFVQNRRRQVLRSMRFRQMTDEEREEIIRKARRMASMTKCCLSDVARHLSKHTGRAVETIRYTIRKHDADNPGQAVFPYLSAPIADKDKLLIYRSFLRGTPVPELARRHDRTRGSIYRIVNEMRARHLLERPIACMYNPQFDLPNADELILGASRSRESHDQAAAKLSKAPPGLPAYLQSLYRVPLFTPEQERDLFRLYNYLKYKADRIRRGIDLNRVRTSKLKEVEQLLVQATAVKNRIIRANLRLVVSIAKKHLGGSQTLFELISDGNVSLMRAVEKFDYSRGNRFSTYASWAIMRNFARSVPRERYRLDRLATVEEDVLDIAAGLQAYDANGVNLPELRESIDVVLAQLTPRERTILVDHFGLQEARDHKTLEQLSHRLGISKERVRQIEIRALGKLRKILNPQRAELLS